MSLFLKDTDLRRLMFAGRNDRRIGRRCRLRVAFSNQSPTFAERIGFGSGQFQRTSHSLAEHFQIIQFFRNLTSAGIKDIEQEQTEETETENRVGTLISNNLQE